MAETYLDFVWDETKGGWVPFSQSALSVAKNQIFPREIINIQNAIRISQFGLEVLRVPAKNWEKEGGKSQFVAIAPISPSEEPNAKLKIQDVVSFIPSAAAAYERWRTSETPLQIGTPGAPGLVSTEGVKAKGVAQNVRDFVKGIFATNAVTVDIDAPLPGDPGYQPVTGLATTGMPESAPIAPTAAPSPMQDLLGGGTQRQPANRGVALRPAPASPLSMPYASIGLDEDDEGIFTINGKSNQLLLPSQTNGSSEAVDADKFVNVTLFNLPPDKVKEFQRKYKVSQTGRMDTTLAAKIFEDTKKISQNNYIRSNPLITQDKTQVSWEDAIINPQYSGGTDGTGGGVSVTAKQIEAAKSAIEISATQLGVILDNKALNSLANSYARGDINSTVLPYEIVRQGTLDYTKGQAAENVNNLRKIANAYGVEFNEDWYKTSVTNILTGKAAQDTYDAEIKELAKSRYPSLAAQIDAGYTVQSIASPYINSMSQILEINPEAINVNDQTIKKALLNITPEGQPSVKPLWQFEQDLRKDERWRYTKNAEQELMGTGIKLLRNFGLI
jgi:hypothetical protein